MNKWVGMGRLTRDPEFRFAQGTNTAIARFSIAVNRIRKREGDPEADFFNVVCFGKTAEAADKYLKQGTKILIVGRVQNDNYTNKDGQKVYGTLIWCEEWEFCESKGNSSPNDEKTQNTANSKPDSEGFMNVPEGLDEELPFN